MTPNVKSLGIDQLPHDVQIALVQEIWDNIALRSKTIPLSERQRKELERRVADDNHEPDNVIAWADVKAKALAKLRQQ